jgi:hypothetical protein
VLYHDAGGAGADRASAVHHAGMRRPLTERVRSSRRGNVKTKTTLMLLLAAGLAAPLAGQDPHHRHHHPPDTGGDAAVGLIPLAHMRSASGTAWLPETSPMRALHGRVGGWEVMGHGTVFLQYIHETTDRGDAQLGSVNWGMLMGRRAVGPGELELRLMMSAEPWTLGGCGYPLLFATGEFCDDQPIHDRQHPHELWMEVAALFRTEVSPGLGLELYGASVGEPALGPVAYPHRPSAWASPLAGIGHHWMDATHIAFGVATFGVFGRRWKAEASLFNGREPDQNRTDFDWGPLDSYAARVWWLPTPRWAFQLSGGHLREAELESIGGPRVDVNRFTASGNWQGEVPGGHELAGTAVWGTNVEEGVATSSVLLEATVSIRDVHHLFWRGEASQKTAHDLVVPGAHDDRFLVSRFTVGYLIEPFRVRGFTPGIGGSVSLNVVPEGLRDVYGYRLPGSWSVYARLTPAAMRMHAAGGHH